MKRKQKRPRQPGTVWRNLEDDHWYQTQDFYEKASLSRLKQVNTSCMAVDNIFLRCEEIIHSIPEGKDPWKGPRARFGVTLGLLFYYLNLIKACLILGLEGFGPMAGALTRLGMEVGLGAMYSLWSTEAFEEWKGTYKWSATEAQKGNWPLRPKKAWKYFLSQEATTAEFKNSWKEDYDFLSTMCSHLSAGAHLSIHWARTEVTLRYTRGILDNIQCSLEHLQFYLGILLEELEARELRMDRRRK